MIKHSNAPASSSSDYLLKTGMHIGSRTGKYMKNHIDIDITIPNHTRYLRMIGRIGENIAQEISCPVKMRESLSSHLAIVLTEGLVNAIRHGNKSDPDKEVHMRINVSDSVLEIRIYDNGAGFDLNSVPAPCFASNEITDTGRGVYILRSLMDTVKYTRIDGGNVLEMKKKLA